MSDMASEGRPDGLDETRDVSAPAVGLGATRTTAPNERATGQGEAVALARGALIGRYVALDRLGAGAMGVVFAAFDPELDRKVAIKLLRPDLAGPSLSAGHDARTRLLREAQALARLSHPNVVAIFDAGVHGDEVWIAMELVEGRTLREWLAERPRGWLEVLDVMRAAGRGLAAAHAAGLVHRDVKPDNVMIAAEGRVRVMDFGLARRGELAEESGSHGPRAMLGVSVTHVGALLGTPAYMAPEQFRGGTVGAQADVFAFCVMLWEGLHGARPFAGASFDELRESVLAGRIVAPADRRAPRWLDEVLRRGLSVEPERRWAGMDGLLAAIDRGHARTRRRGAAATAFVVLLALGGAALGSWSWQRAEHDARVAACEALGGRVDEAWHEGARAALNAALSADPRPFAAGTAGRVTPWLDRWASEWRRVRVDTCAQHEVERAWSDDLRARADECLDERLLGFEALLAELTHGGEEAVTQAVAAAADLSPATACGEPRELERRPTLPEGQLDALRALRPRLARVTALERAGRYKEGLVAGRETLAQAEALAWPPAVAEARLLLGRMENRSGEFKAAESSLEAAYFEAARAGANGVAVDAATLLMLLVGERLGRGEEGLRWGKLAELGLLALGGDGRSVRDALVLHNRGVLHFARSEFQASIDANRAALPIYEIALGPGHPDVSSTIGQIALSEAQIGDRARARSLYESALEARAQALGPEHPALADVFHNLGVMHINLGDTDAALAAFGRSMAILERAHGPDHPHIAETLANVAGVHFLRGELEQVEPLFLRALAVVEKAKGPDSPSVAEILNNLGYVQDALGKHEEALRTATRAVAIDRSAYPGDHRSTALALNNLGRFHMHLGDLAAARRHTEEALAMRERLFPAGHAEIAGSLRSLAHVAALRGDVAEARSLLARATPALTDDKLAEARFAVARAWWDRSPRERAQARELAEQALAGLAGPSTQRERAEVETWLSGHLLPP
jgi:tetratricopeptide (TPR) repeat protein